MKEKDIQTIFKKLIEADPPTRTTVYELKLCKGKSFPFSRVAEHQLEALLNAKNGSLFHKISDMPIFTGHQTRFTKKKPFDCLSVYRADAYIVIVYYKPRKKKEFLLIDIDEFILEMQNSERKSLTEDRARCIAREYL